MAERGNSRKRSNCLIWLRGCLRQRCDAAGDGIDGRRPRLGMSPLIERRRTEVGRSNEVPTLRNAERFQQRVQLLAHPSDIAETPEGIQDVLRVLNAIAWGGVV